MANLMNLKELESYISKDKTLSQVYSGAYLPEAAKKWFGREGKQTSEAAIEMAQRGMARQNVQSTFSKIEAEAKGLGLEVRYDVNKAKNEITVVFVDKKGVVASEKVGLGTANKTLKTNMAAPKSFAPHLSDRGTTLLTQTEEVALSFLETLKKTSQLKTNKIDKRDFLKSQLKAGKKAAEMSVVTSETHSVIDEDEFNIEDMYASSRERDMALHTKMRVGGIIGEVSKGIDFLSGLRKKKKVTEQQARAKNERIDQYLTEYVATYQLLGERVAEDQLYAALVNEELDLTEEQLKSKIAETKTQFGDFLKMKPTFGLSKDEAFKSKKFSYAGTRSAAFRAVLTTGRHLDQVKNYLEKSRKGKWLISKRLDEIFVSADEETDGKDTEHKLYSRTLIEDENIVLAALKQSIEEEIRDRQDKLLKTKKFKKMSAKEQEVALKKIEDDIRAEIPEVNAAILEDMGLTKKSVMEEQESQRLVTGTIDEKEFRKYEKEAIEDLSKKAEKEYNKLSDEQKIAQTQKDFVDNYISTHKADLNKKIAERATGRKGLSSAKITQWQKESGEIGYDIEAEEIIKGNVGKLLWLRTGLRETARGIDDKVFNRLTAKLGVEGTDVLGLAKKIKAEEIPGYAQAILTQKIVNSTNEEKIKILSKLQELGFVITEKDGKYYVDNSMENVEKYNWEGLIDYLTKDLKVFEEEIDKETGKKTYKFAENAKGFRSLQFMDVANRADVWEPTKDVKVGYKEESAALREISAAGLKGASKEALAKDLKVIYDPTQGRTGAVAQKAQKDIDAILNKQTGSIVQTYRSSQSGKSRLLDAKAFMEQSYKRGTTIADTDKTYVITIGNGSGYSIDINDLLKEKAKWDKSGGLTEEEYRKTVWGVIDAAKKELVSQGVSPENIQVAIDPGTDFGFEMYGQGAVGRFIYLPNIETDVRYDGDEAIYSLPEYSQDVNSLLGSLKRGVKKSTVKPKAQAAVQSIFYAGQAEKSALRERAGKKRVGASKAGKVTEISRSKINELIEQGDIEAAERLMSAVYVNRQAGLSMLLDRDRYITTKGGKDVYDQTAHGAFLTEALRYLKGDDIVKNLYGSTEDLDEEMAKKQFAALDDDAKKDFLIKLANQVADAITDTSFSGKVKGLSGIANRFPSLQKHAALFGEMLIGGDLEAAEIRMGPAMTKILNGDYDGDTVNFILGLWSSGMSFDAAAKLVERQKRINRRFYDKMLKGTSGSAEAISGADVSRLKDTEDMGLSALATKFNKPFTGIFSNMSTRIREGLKALGRDYIDESGNVKDLETVDDYVDAINAELVTAVGQILEQDSISAKKVDERIAKRKADGTWSEDKRQEVELEVLNEFKKLEALIRDPETTYEQVIDELEKMGLLGGDDITQISASVTSILEDLIDNISDETKREAVLKRVGLTRDQLSSGKISVGAYRKAGRDLESTLYDETGKRYKIFSGEFGSGLATSRAFTPFMKGDAYQLIKYLTETNDILKETGKIIDENKNKFNEYGETVGKTRGILEGEAAQESAKVIIAGKEGKAIDRNADSYKNLADKLEKAGSNYKEINRLSTSELKSRLLPYAGQQTTGLDPKTLSKLSRKARRGEVLSKEELAAAFGVKDEAALNSLFMGALSTRRGEYIHNLAQGDKTGARAKKKEIADLFKVFGYSDEQIQDTFGIYNLGAKNVKSITKKFGTSMGAEIPFIGMTSDGQYVVNARADELFYKQRPSRWDKNKTEDVVTIVDYKTHAGGKLSDEDIAQGIIYKTFLEEIRDFAKTLDKNISDEEVSRLFQQQIKSGLKYTSDEKEIARREAALSRITPDVAKVLRGGATIETSIIVVDPVTGTSQAYAIGADRDKYKQISNMLLSGDTSPLTAEQKTVLRGGAKQLTSADYFKPGVSSEEKKSIEAQTKSAVSNEQRNESQKEYNTLVSEELGLKKQLIDAEVRLKTLRNIEKRGAKDQEVKDAKATVKFLKDEIDRVKTRQEELKALGAQEVTSTTASNAEKLTYYARMRGYSIGGAEVSDIEKGKRTKKTLTPEEQADYWSQYERALDRQARAEEEVFGIRNKAATTYGTEKTLLLQIADIKDKALVTSQAELDNLERIVSGLGKDAKERVKSLKEQISLNQQLYKLQALKQTRGATSFWDVMANDIQRATMRIADFGIAAKLMNKIPQDIQKIIQYTKELDVAMTNIRIVSGENEEQAQSLMKSYTELAKELKVTTTEVANSANEWLRQGYSAEQANDLIVASTKLAKLGMISTTEATKDLTSAIKGFKLSTEDAMLVVDKLTKVDQVAAISAGNLAEGLARVATTAQQAGLSLDETAAMVTTITEVTQRDASTAGEALRTLISRYSNVKAGVFTDMSDSAEETSENINDIEKVLNKLGIRIRTSGNEMRSIEEVLDELAEKWDTLDDISRNAVASAFAGVRQRESFNILLSNWDRVKELTEESANAAGTADQKYTAYLDSMEAATKRLQNAWEGFTQTLETSTVMKTLTNLTAGLIENFDKLKYLITLVGAFSASRIIDSIANPGKVGGFKGLLANIPIIGTGTKTNNLLENIDKNVDKMRKEQEKQGKANDKDRKTRASWLKRGFGRDDIYDPETGKSISYDDLKSGKLDASQYQKYAGLLKQRQGKNAALGAATTLIAGLFTDKNVDSGYSSKLTKLIAGVDSDITMKETAEGKAWRVGNSTVASAIMGYYLGPLGAQIGAFLGDEFASLTSTLYHLSDLERMQRVKDAKEQLKALESIRSVTEDGNEIMSEKFLDSSGYDKLNKYVENLTSELNKLDPTIIEKILQAVRSTEKTNATSISQLGKDILNADSEERGDIQKAINIVLAESRYNKLIETTEGSNATLEMGGLLDYNWEFAYDYYKEEMDKYANVSKSNWRGITSISAKGETIEEKLDNAQKLYTIFQEEKRDAKERLRVKEYIEQLNELAKLNKELRDSQIQIAYLKSDISDLTQQELADLTMDGVVGKVVKSLEAMGVGVRDFSGNVKSEYLTQIEAMIKADSDMAILTKNDAKGIGELEAAWSDFAEIFGDSVDIYEEVRDSLSKGTFEEYLSAHDIQGDAEALEKLVYAANPERIEQFASAWNMTTEAAKELAKTMPNLTTAMGLMSASEISTKMSAIATIFSDLSKDGKLTVENFNAILKNYPEYINQLGDYEALIGSLGKTLTDESLISYQNALLTTLMGDEGYYKKFKEQLPEELSKLLTGTNAKTLTDVLNLAQTNNDFAALNGELEKFLNQTYELEIDNPLRDLAIEVKEGLLDKQISNLNEQKDALSQINDERKKELEYIKAKIALEDAQKEKKRVYRQGKIMPLSNYIG